MTNVEKMMIPFANEVQAIEDALFVFRRDMRIYNAEGATLDDIGEIVGIDRGTDINLTYRTKIFKKIQLNVSFGTPDNILELIQYFTGRVVTFSEPLPTTFLLRILGDFPDNLDIIKEVLQISPTGVRADVNYVEDVDFAFNFADEGTFTSDGEGFLEAGYSESVGGYTAGKLTERLVTVNK